MPNSPIDDLITQLHSAVSGHVTTPDDPGYDKARTVFAAQVDRRPAAIVQPTTDAEVAAVVTLARESGVQLAVRSGGHSPVGHGVVDDGIVLDLAAMNGLEIDPASRTAWAEAGLTTGAYTRAAGEHGLATGFGDTGTVGIGGVTLAGGAGFLARKHGLTIDSLLAADIVTADGESRRVDAASHPDLFWAIRGGGGNFGVVTRVQFRLHDVGEFVGGMLLLPATPEVVAGFAAAADGAPDELTTIAMVMKAPPMPFIPAEHHGTTVVLGQVGYAGPAADAERALAPFRDLATPLADMVQPMPYPAMFADDEDFRPTAATRSLYLDGFDEADAENVLAALRNTTAPMAAVQLRTLGGAVARVPDDATAYAHRRRRILTNVVAAYQQPDDAPEQEAWVSKVVAGFGEVEPGAYVGFLGPSDPGGARAGYPAATWDRLAQVKRRYDPDNLFRSNHNIPPAEVAG